MSSDLSISQQIEALPRAFGVYQFFDQEGVFLYIGKAVNLKSRVRSYFTSDLSDRPWVKQMIPLIATIKVIQAENDVEALILESNLIKKHQPKYNSASKDDKRYAWIAVEKNTPFPRVKKVRDLGLKARYFGPYPDGRAVNDILKFLRTVYPFRDCSLEMYPDRSPQTVKKSRLCMYHHLGLCTGPCDNLVTPEEYKNSIINIVKTLQGKKRSHIRELEKSMLTLSEDENYEQAARMRDKIRDLQYLSQRIDIHYGDAEDEFRSIQANRFSAGIKEVVAILGLAIPEHRIKRTRIECYDISNLGEEITYGSMVVSEGPLIKPSHYRVFKLTREGKRNDPEMLKQVLERRLKYLQTEEGGNQKQDESLYSLPSLILLDGAQAQLSASRTVIPSNIGILGISKGKHLKRSGQKQQDEFWVIKPDNTIKKVRIENPFLFQHLRDEAHRFAIKHLRQGKRYLQKKSVLDDIPGIGTKRRKLLLKEFDSVGKIKQAPKRELAKALKNKLAAKQVFQFFHP